MFNLADSSVTGSGNDEGPDDVIRRFALLELNLARQQIIRIVPRLPRSRSLNTSSNFTEDSSLSGYY